MTAPLMAAHEISKTYPPALVALKGVSIEIRAAEVISLVGANGAGKSTFTKILTGVEQPSSGTIEWNGHPKVFHTPQDALRTGVSAMYQELPLLPNLSAAENAVIGLGGSLFEFWSRKDAITRYMELGRFVPNPPGPSELIGNMTVGQRQKVAFIRALAADPRVLFVDEGTSSVSAEERQDVYRTLRQLATERDMGVVYITHFIDDALQAGDRIIVLRDGMVVLEGTPDDLSKEEMVTAISPESVAVYSSADKALGNGSGAAEIGTDASKKEDIDSDLQVIDARAGNMGPVSVRASAGECVGLFGPPACGATDLLRSIAGLNPHEGSIYWRHELLGGSVVNHFRRRVVYCNGDRAANVIQKWTVEQNVGLFELFEQPILSRPNRETIRTLTSAVMERYSIVGRPNSVVASLSGGNQQRVIVGRALGRGLPLLLLADDVTRGVDVGGRQQINDMIRRAADEGAVVLFFSTETEEVVDLCDRVYVMNDGRVRRELNGHDLTIRNLESAARTHDE